MSKGNSRRRWGSLEQLEKRNLMASDTLPVLLVIADQQDFYYQEYSDTRRSLEEAGLEVAVAAATTRPSYPHPGTGEGSTSGEVLPDIALTDADAADYSAIAFVGGWGSSQYQYAFEGTYANAAYNGDSATQQAVNDLINDLVDNDKVIAAICHGVTALAWARVDGVSPLAGRTVSAYAQGSPASTIDSQFYFDNQLPTRWHVEFNGGVMVASASVGDPTTATDDVIVDGRIITAENFDSAREFGRVLARAVDPADPEPSAPQVESIAINGGGAQRSMVRSVRVTFSEPVQLDPGAFQLRKLGDDGGAIGIRFTASVVDGKTVATLRWRSSPFVEDSGSLADGNYRLLVRADRVRDLGGTALDGDGDGLAGGNAVDRFFRFFGDSDGDRDVDETDCNRFQRTLGSQRGQAAYNWAFDFDADGDIDSADAAALEANFGETLSPR